MTLTFTPDPDNPAELLPGDNRGWLVDMPRDFFDLILGSPPYNLGASPSARAHPPTNRGSSINWVGYDADADAMPEAEYQQQQVDTLNLCYDVLRPGGSMYYVHCDRLWGDDNGVGNMISPLQWLYQTRFRVRQQIVWYQRSTHQNNPVYWRPVHEYVFWLFKPPGSPRVNGSSVWEIPPTRHARHPAKYPLALAERILTAAPAGGWVLDPWGGTGTSTEAAILGGFYSVTCERAPTYCDLIADVIATTPRLLRPGYIDSWSAPRV